MRALVLTAALALAGSAALAQAPAPAARPAPMAKPVPAAKPGKAALSPDQKKAVSKDCSAQADAQKLHGKAREKFRSHCKSAAAAKA